MHITKQALMERGGMSDLDASRYMNSLRNRAYNDGQKVVRVICDGEVVEQFIGEVPRRA